MLWGRCCGGVWRSVWGCMLQEAWVTCCTPVLISAAHHIHSPPAHPTLHTTSPPPPTQSPPPPSVPDSNCHPTTSHHTPHTPPRPACRRHGGRGWHSARWRAGRTTPAPAAGAWCRWRGGRSTTSFGAAEHQGELDDGWDGSGGALKAVTPGDTVLRIARSTMV